MRAGFVLLFSLSFATVTAQNSSFQFGNITLEDVRNNSYPNDTSANAVFLEEFGESFVQTGDNVKLYHKYYAKVKILKAEGLSIANIIVPLYKRGIQSERINSFNASTYYEEGGEVRSCEVNQRAVIVEKKNKYWDLVKVAVPGAKVGSIIEFAYEIESPFLYNFRKWDFQSDIPKIRSEYVATIPAILTYNISLNGFLRLEKNESELVKDCLAEGTNVIACSRFHYGMTNIPAFREEDYMTSKKNFLSSITYELSEIRGIMNGGIDKVTSEWRAAEVELKNHEHFGQALKKCDNYLKDHTLFRTADKDPTVRAKNVYDYVRKTMEWNGIADLFADNLKRAFDNRSGNAAEINLFLISLLRANGLTAYPVILSTRDNGFVNDLFPALSSFNYVIAGLKVGDQIHLLDATDKLHPFGVLPERCLNGKGRILYDKKSEWVEIRPAARGKHIMVVNLKLHDDGSLKGTLESSFSGYEAVNYRKKFSNHFNRQAYIDNLKKNLPDLQITNVEIKNLDDIEKPVVQKLEVDIPSIGDHSSILFNPFLLGKWTENPFKSETRLYPVDFGTPIEQITILSFEIPSTLEVVNLPENIGIVLPNAGGRYIVDAKGFDNKITLSSSLQINKTIFTSEEYHYLREFFRKVVDVQKTDIMFRKKT